MTKERKAEFVWNTTLGVLLLFLVFMVLHDIHGCSHTQGVIDHASGEVQAVQNPDGSWWVGKPKEAK